MTLIKILYFNIVMYLIFLFFFACSQNKISTGASYPELVYPNGSGTLILFTTEDEKFFLTQQGSVGEAGNREDLNSRLHMYLNLIEEDYHNIRIKYVDIANDHQAVARFQIYDIPTLLLINKYGIEVRRWLPVDFEISGGSVNKLKKEIDQMIKEQDQK